MCKNSNTLLIALLCTAFLIYFIITTLLFAEAKVFMVLMEEGRAYSVSHNKTKTPQDPILMQDFKDYMSMCRSDKNTVAYKEKISSSHTIFLESHLQKGSYTKLYSYTHLLNGFAVHVTSEKVLSILQNATGVRFIHEDVKMEKLTTHSPDFLRIPAGVWRRLGGAETSGEGVVIGFIDTGINPYHPSFMRHSALGFLNSTNYKGKCTSGEQFPSTACNGKVVGAQYFAHAAIANGDFNAARDVASPYDADGHGRQPTYKYCCSSSSWQFIIAKIAVYKALYTFGGYMSDVVAAVDQAVEDGVDILSLSLGPSSVPPGLSAFLNMLELELLFATKAGVLVVQAAGNGGPSSSSIICFSPWITSVPASITDRKYKNTILLGNGQSFSGVGLARILFSKFQIMIWSLRHISLTYLKFPSFISLVHYEANRSCRFIITLDPNIGSEQVKGTMLTLQIPAIILNNMHASLHPYRLYGRTTIPVLSGKRGQAVVFAASARILDGRRATYTGQAPVVAFSSSRGPDVNSALLQTADVLKPNVLAPGSCIWAAWSPTGEGDQYINGQSFALMSSTSMATPHVAGIAALIKRKHPKWGPAAITSAMMTTADRTDSSGAPILAQSTNQLAPATPFDFGAGSINVSQAIEPGLIFNANFEHYVQFLCAVPGVDEAIFNAPEAHIPSNWDNKCLHIWGNGIAEYDAHCKSSFSRFCRFCRKHCISPKSGGLYPL
ncbi:Peptidase S8/S53 domain - like 10 [Theobroma cacao]|nr:Peptidase S8/S53 domain - like 10 [Theobroma cacao]